MYIKYETKSNQITSSFFRLTRFAIWFNCRFDLLYTLANESGMRPSAHVPKIHELNYISPNSNILLIIKLS